MLERRRRLPGAVRPDGELDRGRRALGGGAQAGGGAGPCGVPPLPVFLGTPLPAEMVVRYHAAVGGWGSRSWPSSFRRARAPTSRPTSWASWSAAELRRGEGGLLRRGPDHRIDRHRRPASRKVGILTGSDQFILEAMLMGCDGALIGFAGTATSELIRMHAAVKARDTQVPSTSGSGWGRWPASAGGCRSATTGPG